MRFVSTKLQFIGIVMFLDSVPSVGDFTRNSNNKQPIEMRDWDLLILSYQLLYILIRCLKKIVGLFMWANQIPNSPINLHPVLSSKKSCPERRPVS